MNIKAELIEKTSKSGNQYVVVSIYLTPNLTKDVFLDKAELEAIKLYANQVNYASQAKNDK